MNCIRCTRSIKEEATKKEIHRRDGTIVFLCLDCFLNISKGTLTAIELNTDLSQYFKETREQRTKVIDSHKSDASGLIKEFIQLIKDELNYIDDMNRGYVQNRSWSDNEYKLRFKLGYCLDETKDIIEKTEKESRLLNKYEVLKINNLMKEFWITHLLVQEEERLNPGDGNYGRPMENGRL